MNKLRLVLILFVIFSLGFLFHIIGYLMQTFPFPKDIKYEVGNYLYVGSMFIMFMTSLYGIFLSNKIYNTPIKLKSK